jgi:hypothetical protein
VNPPPNKELLQTAYRPRGSSLRSLAIQKVPLQSSNSLDGYWVQEDTCGGSRQSC